MILFTNYISQARPNHSTPKIEKVGPCLTYISTRRWPIYKSNLVLKPCSFLIPIAQVALEDRSRLAERFPVFIFHFAEINYHQD